MKDFGTLLLVGGILFGLYALNLDTSVPLDYPEGYDYGLPKRVNNIGLMNDKQNYLIFSGLIAVVGLVMMVSAKKPEKNNATPDNTKKCPQCAELVKAEAKICRFCNYSFTNEAIS